LCRQLDAGNRNPSVELGKRRFDGGADRRFVIG
jgi:hypothetical protein